MNSNNYHFEVFEIQVEKAENGQKNGSPEESSGYTYNYISMSRRHPPTSFPQ